MVNSILVTGGAASGKSRWAVTRMSEYDDVLFLCCAPELSAYTKQRIDYGTDLQGVGWRVKTGVTERPIKHIGSHAMVILDGLELYTENALNRQSPDVMSITMDQRREIQKHIVSDVEELQRHIASVGGQLIITTVDVGFSLAPRTDYEKELRGILGSVNQRIANIFDEVWFSASGIQYKIK